MAINSSQKKLYRGSNTVVAGTSLDADEVLNPAAKKTQRVASMHDVTKGNMFRKTEHRCADESGREKLSQNEEHVLQNRENG